jgi:hypothetical protein
MRSEGMVMVKRMRSELRVNAPVSSSAASEKARTLSSKRLVNITSSRSNCT